MPTRVLHVHVSGLDSIPSGGKVKLQCQLLVDRSDGSTISDSVAPELEVKPGLLYRTSIEMNVAIADAAKAHLNTYYSIPTDGYDAVYVTGAYGLLSIL